MPAQKKFRLKFMFQEFDLPPGAFTIGRSPSCNITLEDPLISRTHARLTVYEDRVVLDDLGSRNGTLVNGQPVFEDSLLRNSDRIRIGTHELLFVEEKRYPSAQLRPTGAMIVCSACHTPFTDGVDTCPHCGVVVIPDNICRNCKTPATAEGRYCSKCGSPLDGDDSTVPVEFGGESVGWTSELIDEVIVKALSVKRYEQAATLLDGKIANFEKAASKGTIDSRTLVKLSEHSLAIARGNKDSDRVRWVFASWTRLVEPMPDDLLDAAVEASAGWYDLQPGLAAYLAVLENAWKSAERDQSLLNHLRGMAAKEA